MKKMYSKKLLAMLSALSMTVGMFATVPASADTQSLLNVDFNDGGNGALSQRFIASIDDTGDTNYGKAGHFIYNDDQNAYRDMSTVFDKQSGGIYIYSVDVNVNKFLSVANDSYFDFRLFYDNPGTSWGDNKTWIARIGNPAVAENAVFYPCGADSGIVANKSVALDNNKWYRIDFVLDLDGSTVTYYLNGNIIHTQTLIKDVKDATSYIKTLKGIQIARTGVFKTGTSVFIDNFNIRRVGDGMGDMKIETSSFNNDKNYVDVKFSETIRDSAADLEQKIQVNNAKNNSSVEIDSVTKLTADTIRISFAKDTLSAASEYKVTLNGINNPFGGSTSGTVTFNTPSAKNNSVVEDFNTFDVSKKTTKFGGFWESSNAGTVYTLVDGKDGGEDKAVHITKAKGTAGYPSFRLNISNASTELAALNGRKLGKLSYEFDFKTPESTDGTNIDMQLTLEGSSNISPINIAGKSNAVYRSWGTNNADNAWGKLSGFTKNTWNNIKVELDYPNNKISYYLNNIKIKEYDYDLSNAPTWYNGYLACSSSDANGCVDYTIDNFKISYEETATQCVGEDNTIGIKGFAVTESENGYTVSGTGVNTYAEEKKITVIVCGYDSNGVLTYVNCDPEVALGALRTTAISKEYETDKGSIATVKAFAWENTTGMTPCVMPAQYPNN